MHDTSINTSMRHIENTLIATDPGKERYDATLKELMSDRQFLSRILKRFVPEYKETSLYDLEFRFIESQSIQVASIPVGRNLTNAISPTIEGLNTEDKTLNEGNIYYDIVFKALYPNDQGKYIEMYINLEMQQRYHNRYEVEQRGLFYAARRFSSQLRTISGDTDYSILKKVYSIWLCMGEDVPDKVSNTATLYNISKNDIIGYINKDPIYYDLIDVIVIRLNGKTEVSDPVMELLRTIVDGQMGAEDKIERLKELGIREDRKIEEEVRDMGSFADAIERRALDKGFNRGLDQGYAKGIDQGIAQGITQGMDNEKERTTRLFRFLKDSGKTEELEQAMFDSDQRERLYRLYNIT